MLPSDGTMMAKIKVITTGTALQRLLIMLHNHRCANYVVSSFDYALDRRTQSRATKLKRHPGLILVTAACDGDILDVLLDDITSTLNDTGEIFIVLNPDALPH